jgi:hypothetical protein
MTMTAAKQRGVVMTMTAAKQRGVVMTMTAKEIRDEAKWIEQAVRQRTSNSPNLDHTIAVSQVKLIAEIAAQLAELNETLKKGLTTYAGVL